MRQADRFVPILDIAKETKSLVVLESPPPYRQNLQIDIGTLTGLLGMAGAEEDQLKLSFERQQPLVRAAPTHAGRLAATTKETRFKEEKDQNQRRVSYDPHRQELTLTVSYPDNEVKTPAVTAKNLSRRLTGELSMIPTTKFLTNFLEDLDGKPISGRAVEAMLHIVRMIETAVSAPIVYGILQAGTGVPRPWETLAILGTMNLLDVTFDLNRATNLIRGKPIDEKQRPLAMAIAENPMRVLYPVSLVHELLLPTARILARNSVTSTQLLKSSKE